MTTPAMIRVAAVLLLSSALPLAAQAPGAAGAGTPPRRPLPLDATRKAEFTVAKATWMSLDVSPDGQTIVFDLLGDLYTLPIAGGAATRLTSGPAFDAMPRWSPDGKKVAFVSDRSGGDNVWIMTLDGKDTTQVTQGNSALYVSPEWTPDGEYVVVSRSGGLGGTAKLQMYSTAGGGGLPVIREPVTFKTLGAAFSPDGRYVWYAGRQGDWNYNALFPQYELYRYDRRTGTSALMSLRYGSGFRPAVSPDGKLLVYGTRHDAQTGLRARNLENGEERWLAYPVQRDDMESRSPQDVLPGYSFTPDSRAVVVSYGGEIWRLPVDGGAAARIPFTAAVKLDLGPEVKFASRVDTAAALTARQIRNPAPSPDGKRVAFTALDRLYVMDLPSGTPRRLSNGTVGEFHPTWSPDGRAIAYVTWGDGAGGHIMRVAADGKGRPQQLTSVAALYYNPAWSPDGGRVVATRGPARDLQEAIGFFGGPLGAEFVWVPSGGPVGGGTVRLIAPTGNRDALHFASDTGRLYAYSPEEGLVSFRWDGTDVKQHLKVVGQPPPGGLPSPHEEDRLMPMPRRLAPFEQPVSAATGDGMEPTQPPPPAGIILMAPKGDLALAQVGRDLYTVMVPFVGGPVPQISVATPQSAPVPVRKLTDIGGEFPSWSADGRKIHWGIGNAFVTYDLDRAKVVEDSLKVVDRQRADSTRQVQAQADTLRRFQQRADSLRRASQPVPDSVQTRITALKADSTRADSVRQASRRADSARAGPDTTRARPDSTRADTARRYRPEEIRVKVTAPRDVPRGTAVLRGARAITMKGTEVIENTDVVIRDNRIVAVGARGSVEVPRGARVIDVTGKTLLPGFVDTHYHPQWLIPEIHPGQAWHYLTNLAYGVTTTRDPQTATTDVLTYGDLVETGAMVGPRIYSTGPGVFVGENIRDLDHARNVLKRYGQYWDTKTLKMYMSGNRQQRQWIIMAAKELGLMPTTEGGLDYKLNLTHAMDGYPGIEHALPITPMFEDVVQLFKATQTTNSPTLLVSYGGPFGENFFYSTEDPGREAKLMRFTPQRELDAKTRRRGATFPPYQQGGWFHKDEYVYPKHAQFVKQLIEGGGRAGLGSHGQLQGLGYHWELWAMGSGGLSNHDALRVATIYGAEAIGLAQDVGTLEAGKLADILVLDENPLQTLRNSKSIRYVMKNGRLYEGETLAEIWPRRRALVAQWWQGGAPQTAAGIR